MTAAELEHRRPVWIALADLFLDTDVRLHYVGIVTILAASPYSASELWAILDDEVTPALQTNLTQVAGEWAAFDEDWVVEQVLPRAGKRRWMPNLVSMKSAWQELAPLVERIRSLPEAERQARIQAWAELMPVILSSLSPPKPVRCAELGRAESEQILRQELLPALTSVSPDEVEENWRQFAEALP